MKYVYHIVGWLAILLLPYMFAVKGSVDFRHLVNNQHEINNLLNYAFLILFSYLNYLVLVPRLYLKRKYFFYFGAVVICFLIVVFLPEGFDSHPWPAPPDKAFFTSHGFQPPPDFHPGPPPGHEDSSQFADPNHSFDTGANRHPDTGSHNPGHNPHDRPMIRYFAPPPPFFVEKSAIMLLFFVSIVVAISVHLSIYLQKTEKGQLNAELSYLKMQIHPHFLFNALNTIYSLSIRKDDRTPDAVIKLSELMRYVIRDAAHHRVPLDKELAYISNYISLQQSGLAGTVRIDYRIEGDPGQHQIAPLILIPFIENAFKHGVNPDEETKIICHISVRGDELQMLVSNRKVPTIDKEPGGIGIQNAKERLQLLYPARHTLTVADTPRDYTVQLIIVLT